MQIDLKPYVQAAIERAAVFVDDETLRKKETGKCGLDGTDPAEDRQIAQFFLSNNGRPYSTPTFEKAVEQTMADVLAKDPARDGKQIYIGGPLPANALLSAAMNRGASGKSLETLLEGVTVPHVNAEAIRELQELNASSLRVNLGQTKQSIANYSGLPVDPYACIRPINSGTGQTFARIAIENGLNFIQDDQLNWRDDKEKAHIFNNLIQRHIDAGRKVGVYAVLPTPEEAEQLAPRFGLPADEARASAERFAKQWKEIARAVPDVTLFNVALEVVYMQRDFIQLALPGRSPGVPGAPAPAGTGAAP